MSERHHVEALRQEAVTLKAASKNREASYPCKICEVNNLLEKNRRKSVNNERSVKLQAADYNDGFESDPDCSSIDDTVHASDDEEEGNRDELEDESDEDAEGKRGIIDEKYWIERDKEGFVGEA